MTERLFVYGTLRRGSRHPLAEQLAAVASYLGEARYNGRLYRITHYPGAVASSLPGEWVFGDVFELRDPGILTALDSYEGCGPDDPVPTQYLRKLQQLTLAHGTSVEAWMYIYNWPIANRERIMTGRFEEADV
jgi:gamma-glutamylcyclotransferase (GGCT)/AIG2-like uncharacterized protein YtfP